MASKKPRKDLTINDKKEILDKVDKGITYRCLASEYGCCFNTISYIVSTKENILRLWNSNCSLVGIEL